VFVNIVSFEDIAFKVVLCFFNYYYGYVMNHVVLAWTCLNYYDSYEILINLINNN